MKVLIYTQKLFISAPDPFDKIQLTFFELRKAYLHLTARKCTYHKFDDLLLSRVNKILQIVAPLLLNPRQRHKRSLRGQ